jgi:hypothetical protein
MTVNTKVIDYILSEVERFDEYKKHVATHESSNGRVLAKLLYYRKSVWDAPENKSGLLLGGDISEAFDASSRIRTVDMKDDGVIPFVLILEGNEDSRGTEPGGALGRLIETGAIYQVSNGRVTGEDTNPEFAMMADMIKKNRTGKDGKIMLENVITPKQKIESLERNWGKLRVENPWFEWSKDTDLDDYLFYELPTPEIKAKIKLSTLKNLLKDERVD